MKVSLQTFAVLKDAFGPTIEIEIQPTSTVADIFSKLNETYPEKTNLWKRCRVAVNNRFESIDHPIQNTDSLSIMPPSSGG